MSAAEVKFPNPPEDKPQWLSLAQAVFNSQVDTKTCCGGLRWQIFTFNKGYTYKNSTSNSGFFNLASRLAVYTGNLTYAEWAEKAFDWIMDHRLICKNYWVYDGANDRPNCTEVDPVLWMYNAGQVLLGTAHMYVFTNGSEVWKRHLDGIVKGLNVFFPEDNVMREVGCESVNTCTVDHRSFKAILSRRKAHTIQVAPFTKDALMPKLRASAKTAAVQYSGPDGACGLRWNRRSRFDGITGVGEHMAALQDIQGNLVGYIEKRVTAPTGGISKGKLNAGNKTSGENSDDLHKGKITRVDVIGARIFTASLVLFMMTGVLFMVT
ncbi:hydrolase 76 protein [Aspergillus hancockii]|nr:hydrolase 76 protein [Aspergillus hancockii]